jgi:hypothetical protein
LRNRRDSEKPAADDGTPNRATGALEVAAAGAALGVSSGLADLFLGPGAGIGVAGLSGALSTMLGRHAEKQSENLVEQLRERVARLEATGTLDRDRLERIEELGGPQAFYANALSGPEKTSYYADLLAGVVSTEAPDAIDVEAFLDTIQSLSPAEIELARNLYDRWEANEDGWAHMRGVYLGGGEDSRFYSKRLEGAGLLLARLPGGPPGAPIGDASQFEPTPTLARLLKLLRSGRAEVAESPHEGELPIQP